MRVEHAYARQGACTCIAAWDVHRAKVFGACVARSAIAHFDELVGQVMARPPYNRARRVFWIMDNASIHRGQRCTERFRRQWPTARVLHTPIHASWLNQIEVYFSIVQRRVLTPNNFINLDQLQRRLLEFQRYYEAIADPFKWQFTRHDLRNVLQRPPATQSPLANAA